MNKYWIALPVCLVFLLLLSAGPTGAQGTVTLTIDSLETVAFPTMRLLVTVRDGNGTPITDLTPADFAIIEDGKSTFPPTEAVPQTNPEAAVSVAIIIDLSGSMKGKPLEQAKEATRSLLDKLLDVPNDKDKAAFIGFGQKVDLDPTHLDEKREVPFTNDKNALLNVINFLEVEGDLKTPLYDAIYKVVKMTTSEPLGKRAIILMTDGRDLEVSVMGADDPINEANRNYIPVFPIGLSSSRIDRQYLQRLALRTGGVYQEAPEPEQLEQLFQNVLGQLKQQYVLTYKTTLPKDAQPHSVLVRMTSPRGQAFNEEKFFVQTPTPVPPGRPTATPGMVAPPTPTPTEAGVVGRIKDLGQDAREFVEDKPIVAAGIAGGVLLVLILLVVLVVILRRRAPEYPEEAYPEFEPGYEAPPPYGPEPGLPRAPAVPPGRPTEVARAEEPTGPWEQPTEYGPPPAPFPPPGVPPFPPPTPAPAVPAAETRIIKRPPRYMALLVDRKTQAKYDLDEESGIGRAKDNDVVLDHATVSRQHAKIRLEGDRFLVFDLGSSNGTFVNDVQVREPVELKDGDVVRFGEAELVFKRV